MRKKLIKFLFPLLLIFLTIPLLLPFLRKGYFVTHDGEWAIVRLSAFHFALRDGQLPPRWAGNLFHTYGYPVLNFNYPLPPIIGEILHLLGFSFVDSVKGVFILSVVFSAVFFYLFLNEIFSQSTALLGTIFYLYYPFRMVDLYVRGSVGESLVFALLPLVYWSLIKLKKRKNKRWLAISSLSTALLILAHNSLALVSLPFIFLFMIYLFFLKKDNQSFFLFLVSVLLAFTLSCFFWLPALYEKQWTNLLPEIITKPTHHFVELKELIIPKNTPSLSFQLGLVHLVFALLSLWFLFFKKFNYLVLFFVFVLSINLFFLFPVSKIFWEKLPLLVFVSYPWRLMVPLGFYLSIISSYFLVFFNQTVKFLIITLIFLVLFFMTKTNRQPAVYINKDDMYYITNQSTTIEGDENTPLWVKEPPKIAPKEKIELKGSYQIEKLKSNLIEFSVAATQPQEVRVNTLYYPGWRVFVDGKERVVNYENSKGVISFKLFPEDKHVKLVFQETTLRLIADIISFFSFLGLLILFL